MRQPQEPRRQKPVRRGPESPGRRSVLVRSWPRGPVPSTGKRSAASVRAGTSCPWPEAPRRAPGRSRRRGPRILGSRHGGARRLDPRWSAGGHRQHGGIQHRGFGIAPESRRVPLASRRNAETRCSMFATVPSGTNATLCWPPRRTKAAIDGVLLDAMPMARRRVLRLNCTNDTSTEPAGSARRTSPRPTAALAISARSDALSSARARSESSFSCLASSINDRATGSSRLRTSRLANLCRACWARWEVADCCWPVVRSMWHERPARRGRARVT